MQNYRLTAIYIKGLRAAQLHRLGASPATLRIPGRSLAPAPAAWSRGGRCCRLRPTGMPPNADSLYSGSGRWPHVLDPCFVPGRESPRCSPARRGRCKAPVWNTTPLPGCVHPQHHQSPPTRGGRWQLPFSWSVGQRGPRPKNC